jgi:perosamine synthetase
MPAITEVAHKHGAIAIEDASHAVGGAFHREGRVWKIGGHHWADMTAFSLHPVNTMTTGGGMLVTDDAEWASRIRELRSHGMPRDRSRFIGLISNSASQLSTSRARPLPWATITELQIFSVR